MLEPIIPDDYYFLDITPMGTPRPRVNSKGWTYMPNSYQEYCKSMIYEMRKLKIIPDYYGQIKVLAYFPYPITPKERGKIIPKTERIEGRPMRKKPDYDNTVKAITDCLTKMEIIEDDDQIWRGIIEKRYTIQKQGRIFFKLKL
jgi:Holliday junction resolvase RusA-like endonuclease